MQISGGVLHPLTHSPKPWHCPNDRSSLQVLSETVEHAPINVLPLIITTVEQFQSINNLNKACGTNEASSVTSYCSELDWGKRFKSEWFIECICTHFHHLMSCRRRKVSLTIFLMVSVFFMIWILYLGLPDSLQHKINNQQMRLDWGSF